MTDALVGRDGDTLAGRDALVRRLEDWNAARLAAVADEYGTPVYLLDADRVRANYRRLADAFAAEFPNPEVVYAAKANSSPAVLGGVVDAGGTIECAGRGELRRAVRAGADPNAIRYTAVNPPAADLDAVTRIAAEHPVFTVIVGARDTADRLEAREFAGQVGLRVNPGIGTGHHEAVATGRDAQFGVPAERAERVADDLRESPLSFVGVHAHVGSGVLPPELDDHCRALARVASVAREIGTGDLQFVDFGGGFGVPYRPTEEPLDPTRVARRYREAIGTLDARVIVEPGRYVAADAGVLLTRVNTVKPTAETRVVGCDASLATLVRPAMFDAHHPIRNCTADRAAADRDDCRADHRDGRTDSDDGTTNRGVTDNDDRTNRERVACTVGGPCCTSADTFCTDRRLASPERGDLLAIGMAGAYGYELTSRFHSQPRPTEVAIEDGEVRVARGGETIDDVLATDEW